jgi:PhnB protein
MPQVKPIPEGTHSITPYLMVRDARQLIAFLASAFDGRETERFETPDGRIMHAQVRIGDSTVMLSDATGEWKPTSSAMYLYVQDVDATYKQALKAGGASVSEPADQFYGDRHGGVKDPAGNFWWIATHIEDVPPEEMKRRAAAFMKEKARA